MGDKKMKTTKTEEITLNDVLFFSAPEHEIQHILMDLHKRTFVVKQIIYVGQRVVEGKGETNIRVISQEGAPTAPFGKQIPYYSILAVKRNSQYLDLLSEKVVN